MSEKKDVLMKNNALIKARYDINTYENKLFILLLYKLQKINETTCVCSITTSQIKEILNARTVRNKKEISDLLTELRKRSIYFKNGNKWGEYGFINGHEYDDDTNTFYIEASEKVYSLLRDYLHHGYTPINMEIWLSLKSSYAQRFYDFLRLWSNTRTNITYKIDELRELLMLENKYNEYRDFKRRVISPAIKELNSTGFFEITIQENKVGRKVESIDFIVKDLDKRVYFDKKEKNKAEVEREILNLETSKFKEISSNTNRTSENDNEFYVPNRKLFTKKTLDLFEVDFGSCDFKDNKIKNIFYETIGITLEKDDEEKIKIKSYNYFKKTLENKIATFVSKPIEMEDKVFKKTKFHNFNETYTNYSQEELDELILKSQKKKYNDR